MRERRVSLPLVVKLIGIISLIVVISMGLVTGLATWFYAEDSRIRGEEQNLLLSQILAVQVENELHSLYSGALSLLDTLREFGGNPAAEDLAGGNYFARNPVVAYLGVPGEQSLHNRSFLSAWELEEETIGIILERNRTVMDRAREGETVLVNVSGATGIPTALLAVPYTDMGSDNAMVLIFSTEHLQAILQTNAASEPYLVGYRGEVLAHPDQDLVLLEVSYGTDPLVEQMFITPLETMQIQYETPSGDLFFGAFRKIPFGQAAVLSRISRDVVLVAALAVVRQNLYLTGIVLVLSVLAVWFFSKTVSRPVMALVRGARQIQEGHFELALRPTTRDELGLLTERFVEMGRGLAERERIKDTFGKFVNKDIAEQALQGRLELGGQRKTATIFFSDIRSFTAISETMDPESVVEFLNEYMTLMVSCVEKTHGVVDKFIGDAIMAVWGAPVSQGSAQADALLSIKSMLMMRNALLTFNRDRGGPGKPIIRIGCGVNTGICLAGQIGSAERMEYTVIGDAVNLASRIEALNKPLGTDILISEFTWELVRDHILAEEMPPIRVKGKTAPLKIYAVINLKGLKGPQTLEEVRQLLGMAAPGALHTSGTTGPDGENEVKYEILPE
ncbi:family 3 adenylate cyclase [Alkalispirochaeta sphaeroplastigenens]|uniref:Family 3 adenylate cyclase n=1 Tax=Alkalispirochaeta sphaeroplastigenens TaxID=1187066 RepID=A0A2S4JLW0_9SPIO|nr:adenylate/guanylate cyclase domain-containing protein [Alkalispirochaeta sphaeroplastigenens]POR00482.1 family 3 adenylate cyclase [Alkalispirochaeta sphaeroplastigenens]